MIFSIIKQARTIHRLLRPPWRSARIAIMK
jgi:hypothetical protein